MGIKGLWTVLTPYSEKKSLHEIRGETIAVDLSGWVCDSQNVTDYHVQPKLYLRNLFFRTIYLLLSDINPVFVLEGDAPELKRDVMAARNAIQFRGAAPKSDTVTNKRPDVGRKRFKNVLKECENLLRCMGVRCIKGTGEAEATCAQLNAQGVVNAVVSQDSDCFAYGARRVYRNFSVSSAAGGGAMQGSVDCYDADVMFKSNGFGRNKMVALALLCGCDYGVGACGSSINTVVSFLHTVPDKDVIPRLLSWITDTEYYDEQSRWLNTPGRCDRCGHGGRTHTKNGCPICATHRGCNDTGHKSKVADMKRELSLRNRALSCGMPFPEPKVMKEFLNRHSENVDLDSLRSPAPSLIQFVKLMTKKLDWSERYCLEKFLPLLTKWHLQDHVPCRTIKPETIKKKRNPRGIPSYEVVWCDIDGQYDALIPDDQYSDGEDPSVPWTSIERQDLIRQYYPDLVNAFEESIKKPVKEKKTKSRKKKDNDENSEKPKRKYTKNIKAIAENELKNLNESLKDLGLILKGSEHNSSKLSVSVNKLKRKIKNSKSKSQKTIDSFISKKRKSLRKSVHSLRCSLKNMSINNLEYHDLLFNEMMRDEKENIKEVEKVDIEEHTKDKKELYMKSNVKEMNLSSVFDMSEEQLEPNDLSDIVDNMIKSAPVAKSANVDGNLYRIVFEKYLTPKKEVRRKSVLSEIHKNCSTPIHSPVRKSFKYCSNVSNNSVNCKVNTSYFFDKLTEDCDAFEMSLEYKNQGVVSLNCDTTVEYSLPDVCL